MLGVRMYNSEMSACFSLCLTLLITKSFPSLTGHDQAGERPDAPSPQNTFNTHEEQRLRRMPEELAVFLNVAPDATCATCEDGSLDVERLIQRSVCKHFPKPPAHLDKNLRKHLLDVQEAVLHELLRLGPLLEPEGLMGCLLEHYHCQTFDHLHCLLQNVTSTKNSFVLMHWVLHTYQRYLNLPAFLPTYNFQL